MSISLVAVFFPILLMGGIVGRIFHEFAMTLTIAIIMSLIVSLTVTPMMCAYLDFTADEDENWLMRWSRAHLRGQPGFLSPHAGLVAGQSQDHHGHPAGRRRAEFLSAMPSCPRASSRDRRTARISGGIRGDQSISFQAMQKKFMQFVDIIRADPAVADASAALPAAAAPPIPAMSSSP